MKSARFLVDFTDTAFTTPNEISMDYSPMSDIIIFSTVWVGLLITYLISLKG